MFATSEELLRATAHIKVSPKDNGSIDLIVCRPVKGERQELLEAELDLVMGLLGDNWATRGNPRKRGTPALADTQLTLMNSRAIAAIAKEKNRWKLAGDQFFVDFDLSYSNVPPGTRLVLGEAMIEVTSEPHLGCAKFRRHYGQGATAFVNSPLGKSLNLRGINAKVVVPGLVWQGAAIHKIKT
jgi:hypothetical protein